MEARHNSSPGAPSPTLRILEWEGFVPDLSDHAYVEQLKARMQDRLNYVEGLKDVEGRLQYAAHRRRRSHPQGGGPGQQPVS